MIWSGALMLQFLGCRPAHDAIVEAIEGVLKRGPLTRDCHAFRHMENPAPVPAVETGDQALVRGLLLQGPMLTVLSTRQLRYEFAAGHLCVLALPMEGRQRQIGLTTRTQACRPPHWR